MIGATLHAYIVVNLQSSQRIEDNISGASVLKVFSAFGSSADRVSAEGRDRVICSSLVTSIYRPTNNTELPSEQGPSLYAEVSV